MITIRKATIEDLSILYEFEQGVLKAERPMDKTLKISKTYYYDIPNLISELNVELVIAEKSLELSKEAGNEAYIKMNTESLSEWGAK